MCREQFAASFLSESALEEIVRLSRAKPLGEHHQIGIFLIQIVEDALVISILVPLGLTFFIPIAFAPSWGLGVWSSAVLGVLAVSVTIGAWFAIAPR